MDNTGAESEKATGTSRKRVLGGRVNTKVKVDRQGGAAVSAKSVLKSSKVQKELRDISAMIGRLRDAG